MSPRRSRASRAVSTSPAVSTDRLYPVRLSEEIARARPGTGLTVIDSPHGHDGFLIETAQVGSVIGDTLHGH